MFKELRKTNFGDFLLGEDDVSRRIFESDFNFMWDGHLREYYEKYTNGESIVIDVGANIGTHSIYLGKTCKKVYAFEPQVFLYYQLCGNVFINNLLNVVCINKPCYDKHIKLKLTHSLPDYLNWNVAAGQGYSISEDGKEVIILDEFIPKDEKIDLIKVDAQGSDLRVLLGAENIIIKDRPVILFEIESAELSSPHDSNAQNYFDFFTKHNYTWNNFGYGDWVAIPNEKRN